MKLLAALTVASSMGLAPCQPPEPVMADVNDCAVIAQLRIGFTARVSGESAPSGRAGLRRFAELSLEQETELQAAIQSEPQDFQIACSWNRRAPSRDVSISFAQPVYTADGAWVVVDRYIEMRNQPRVGATCLLDHSAGDWREVRCAPFNAP